MAKPEEIRKIDTEPRIPGESTPEVAEHAGEVLAAPGSETVEQASNQPAIASSKELPAVEDLPISDLPEKPKKTADVHDLSKYRQPIDWILESIGNPDLIAKHASETVESLGEVNDAEHKKAA